MPSNVFPIPAGPRWRVLVGHARPLVRHALRTLIEAEDVAVVEVADGEAALTALERGRFDLLVLQLDLPEQDGARVMLMHRVLLTQQKGAAIAPPDVILTLPPEVRDNGTVLDRLRSLGVTELIDDEPRPEVAALVEMILRARTIRVHASGTAA